MLLQYSALLEKLKIVLASQSPRRKQIFRDNLGIKNFQVVVSGFAEDIPHSSCAGPEDYVSRTCRAKCIDVVESFKSNSLSNTSSDNNNSINSNDLADIVISADTIVVLNNKILEKPVGKESAYAMLRSLSNNENHVLTAVTLATLKSRFSPASADISGGGGVSVEVNSVKPSSFADLYNITTFCKSSSVRFADLSDEVINAYIDSGEPFDKAGGYGMQSLGASLVTSINGCFFNVMGFPVHKFCEELVPILNQFQINNASIGDDI